MRTWILGSALLIADAIRPEYEYGMVISVFMIVLFVAGFWADWIDFFNRRG